MRHPIRSRNRNHPAPLKMVATAICIPKSDPELPLGQDAYFIAAKNQWIGVFDGVGGWRKYGIDSGIYAQQLMHNSVSSLQRNEKEEPWQVLEEAYRETTALGSSTACIASLSDGVLRVVNVGDSGCLIIRDDEVIFRSEPQQHEFNYPYQLGAENDGPSVADMFEFTGAEKGDLVLLATDGLLDNVHEDEMLHFINHQQNQKDLHGLCRKIAETALSNSLNDSYDSPFSIAAREAGYPHSLGGKMDDITLVVARIQ